MTTPKPTRRPKRPRQNSSSPQAQSGDSNPKSTGPQHGIVEDQAEPQLADLPPKDLLLRHADFAFYQELGECLHYDPQINACGMTLPLSKWNPDALKPEVRTLLKEWTRSNSGAAEFERQLLSASTWVFGGKKTYHGLLVDVAIRLKAEQTVGNYLQREEAIVAQLQKRLQEGFLALHAKLSDAQKKDIDHLLQVELHKKGIELAKKTSWEWFLEGTLTGTVGFGLEKAVRAFLVPHPTHWQKLLHPFAHTVAWWIPFAILAPYKTGVWIWSLGDHNYVKTVPCVIKLHHLRKQAIGKTQS